jgi:hypothetical protein
MRLAPIPGLFPALPTALGRRVMSLQLSWVAIGRQGMRDGDDLRCLNGARNAPGCGESPGFCYSIRGIFEMRKGVTVWFSFWSSYTIVFGGARGGR